MDTFDESLDFTLERALQTLIVMNTLSAPPYAWVWDGVSSGNFQNNIDLTEDQVVILTARESATSEAGTQWDQNLITLVTDAALGTRLARLRYKDQPAKLKLFKSLRYQNTGRDSRYEQALDFESSWRQAEPGWIFRPGLTLAQYTLRREAIQSLKVAQVTALKAEQHERAVLHNLADTVNRTSVDWYETATATFAEDTVPGQLIRTIPTTYDPNHAPGQLRFTAHWSAAPNQVRLVWRATRGEKFYIRGQPPGSAVWEMVLDGAPDKQWVGLGLTPGPWRFEGHATNQFGPGPTSLVVDVMIAAAQAA